MAAADHRGDAVQRAHVSRVVKGDEAVLCKVIGQDNGKPVMAPNPQSGEIQPVPAAIDPDGQVGSAVLQPHWLIKPGAKAKRARRVSDYLNTSCSTAWRIGRTTPTPS
jgi:hypothetical protein